MNILSLFDGMSCGQIAAERAGLPVSKYYASEIDEYAITVTMANYPNTIQLGDITTWREWDVDWASIDLIIGGSPCQGFSFAGKQLAFNDPRSALFFVYVDILEHILGYNPDVKFLMENVRMKKDHLDIITSFLGVDPVFINSALVSAHNRQRFYWSNWDFSIPEDLSITMSDIVEDGYWSPREKSYCIDANYWKGTNFRRYFFSGARQIVLEDGYNPKITSKEEANDIMHSDGNRWRKLTPEECEKLQTVPEGYTNHVSNSRRYSMLGNGWTVDVIAHIFKELK